MPVRTGTTRVATRLAAGTLVATLGLLAGCGPQPAGTPQGAPTDWFVDAAGATGLNFSHDNGMSGHFYQAEMMGSGVALFDFDNDGDLDVYLVQGGPLGPPTPASRAASQGSAPAPGPAGGRLYRNDLTVAADGTRTLRFTDITAESGIKALGYGMGVATGDFNHDGCIDVYLTYVGRNQLYRNNCDGTFTDVSKASGTDDEGWSVSAAFVDADRDGWPDLFVGHYLNDAATTRSCLSPAGTPDYCPPGVYQAQRSRFYHNNRDGTFTDATERAGLAREFGPALGVVAADFNGDGWADLYVANDEQPNQLWINRRDGTFTNAGLLSGAALPAHGSPEASMGVDAGDFDNDGDDDLFMTELTGQGANLYVNDGTGTFDEESARAGLEAATLGTTGFGTAWLDFDNDGWLDLLVVNGAVQTIEALARAHNPYPLGQRKQLFRNLGNGRFEDVTSRAGAAFASLDVGRGAAFGDIDNDGDIDVVVNNSRGRAQLLLNMVGSRRHWVGLQLPGASGARVSFVRPNAPTLWRHAHTDGSYASASDPRVLAGLGDSTTPPRVRVQWPDGRREEWSHVSIDRYTTLKEGTGE